MKEIILASASPRRIELLNRFDLRIRQHPVHIDESVKAGESPKDYAIRMANEKSRTCLEKEPGSVILGADTIVLAGNEILLKPHCEHEAEDMLKKLSGTWHSVMTSVCLCHQKCATFISETRVRFKKLSSRDIEWYVSTGEPWDKAGGYGIQGRGSLLVDRIEGDYETVMGLPVRLLPELFDQCGLDLYDFML